MQMNLTGTVHVDGTRTVEFGHTGELVVIKRITERDGVWNEIELNEEEARYLLHYLSMIFRGELD